MEFGNADPAVQAVMRLTGFSQNLNQDMTNHPELSPYITGGKFAIGQSIRDWNESWAQPDNMKKWWYFQTYAQTCS